MYISWLGEAGIKLQVKDTVVLIDPPSIRPIRQAAQIVALTQRDGREWKSVAGDPFIIDTPGEYERSGVFVYGLNLQSEPNRVHFRVEADELSLGHLAELDHKIDNGELEPLEGVDILILPVGGKSVLTPDQATELISQIEPRIIIPIQYQVAGLKTPYGPCDAFLKAVGAKDVEPVDKYRAEKKNLPAAESQVIVLNPS